MAYRKTKRSIETLAKMRAGKDRARMDRPAPEYPAALPDLRRRIVVESFDFGHDIHVLEFFRTDRIDCFRVVVDGKEWKRRISNRHGIFEMTKIEQLRERAFSGQFYLLSKEYRELLDLVELQHKQLSDAVEHLEFCGYGDSYERDCARDSGLMSANEAALKAFEERNKP